MYTLVIFLLIIIDVVYKDSGNIELGLVNVCNELHYFSPFVIILISNNLDKSESILIINFEFSYSFYNCDYNCSYVMLFL